eukprot:5740676-Prymnesium_polylepis.2
MAPSGSACAIGRPRKTEHGRCPARTNAARPQARAAITTCASRVERRRLRGLGVDAACTLTGMCCARSLGFAARLLVQAKPRTSEVAKHRRRRRRCRRPRRRRRHRPPPPPPPRRHRPPHHPAPGRPPHPRGRRPPPPQRRRQPRTPPRKLHRARPGRHPSLPS